MNDSPLEITYHTRLSAFGRFGPFCFLFAAQSQDMANVQQRAQDALLETISTMTPERRAVFATDLLEELRRGPRNSDRNSGG